MCCWSAYRSIVLETAGVARFRGGSADNEPQQRFP
jgi:hypothetical protein